MYKVDVVALRVKMAERGINSMVEFCNRSGVSLTSIHNLMHGKTMPDLVTIQKLAETLDLTSKDAGEIFFAKVVA